MVSESPTTGHGATLQPVLGVHHEHSSAQYRAKLTGFSFSGPFFDMPLVCLINSVLTNKYKKHVSIAFDAASFNIIKHHTSLGDCLTKQKTIDDWM